MGKYLEQAASPRVLNHAWRYLRNERGLWRRGLPVVDMQRDVIRHVGELSEQLRDGSYRPNPMRCFEVDKANGGTRLICASCVRDKLVQRGILTVVEPLGEGIFHDASFGFGVPVPCQGSQLRGLLDTVTDLMRDHDELRIYRLTGGHDLWFLSDEKPAIPAMRPKLDQPSMWTRFLKWSGA